MEEDDDSVPVLVYNVDPNGYHHHVLLPLLPRQYNSSNTVAFVFGIVDIVIVNIESMMMRMLVHRIVVVAIPFGKCVG